MDRVAVRYIGGRPFWADNLYGTGKTWANGEAIAVPAAAARRLLVHPEFEEAAAPTEPAPAEPVPAGADSDEQPGSKDTEDDDIEAVNISTMSRAQLAQFAKSKYGVDVPMGAKPAMVERVRGLLVRSN